LRRTMVFVSALIWAVSLCGQNAREPALRLVRQHPAPVITVSHPDAAGNKYGFEGGRVVKVGGVYQLFTSEMVGDPIWVKMKLARWTSVDGLHWKRAGTLYESSGEFAGKDPRAALWAPMPVYDEAEKRWNLFYVAYRCAPDLPGVWLNNYDAQIWRAVSEKAGEDGIGGPYRDVGVVLEPGADSEMWEGLQGTDSFFPYRTEHGWYGFYGSARTEFNPIRFWGVGLAAAPATGGPWNRVPALNPVPLEKKFAENPVVEPLPHGGYMALYDVDVVVRDSIGYAYSADGIHWNPGRRLTVQPTPGQWATTVRTPLGLVAEGNGTYSLFYTGEQKQEPHSVWSIGMVTLKLE
jgi:hypothetical protein